MKCNHVVSRNFFYGFQGAVHPSAVRMTAFIEHLAKFSPCDLLWPVVFPSDGFNGFILWKKFKFYDIFRALNPAVKTEMAFPCFPFNPSDWLTSTLAIDQAAVAVCAFLMAFFHSKDRKAILL